MKNGLKKSKKVRCVFRVWVLFAIHLISLSGLNMSCGAIEALLPEEGGHPVLGICSSAEQGYGLDTKGGNGRDGDGGNGGPVTLIAKKSIELESYSFANMRLFDCPDPNDFKNTISGSTVASQNENLSDLYIKPGVSYEVNPSSGSVLNISGDVVVAGILANNHLDNAPVTIKATGDFYLCRGGVIDLSGADGVDAGDLTIEADDYHIGGKINLSGGDNKSGSGGNGGDVNISGGPASAGLKGFVFNGDFLNTRGGKGENDGGSGGNITIDLKSGTGAEYEVLISSNIDTGGGNGKSGGGAGDLAIQTRGLTVINGCGKIKSFGGNGYSGPGGVGGSIDFEVDNEIHMDNVASNINTSGGDVSGVSGNGGNGGDITISAGDDAFVESDEDFGLITTGGNASEIAKVGNGGSGGAISIFANEDAERYSILNTYGGIGAGGICNANECEGGAGGDVIIQADADASHGGESVFSKGDIDTRGGDGGSIANAQNGGDAGNVTISSEGNDVGTPSTGSSSGNIYRGGGKPHSAGAPGANGVVMMLLNNNTGFQKTGIFVPASIPGDQID